MRGVGAFFLATWLIGSVAGARAVTVFAVLVMVSVLVGWAWRRAGRMIGR